MVFNILYAFCVEPRFIAAHISQHINNKIIILISYICTVVFSKIILTAILLTQYIMILKKCFVFVALIIYISLALTSCQYKLKAAHIIGSYTFASGTDFLADSCIFIINKELECSFCSGINVPFLERPFLPNHTRDLKDNMPPKSGKPVGGQIKNNEYQFFKSIEDKKIEMPKWSIYINKQGKYILRVYHPTPNNAYALIMVERQLNKIK